MNCKNCGASIAENSMFCPVCGMNTNNSDSKLIVENNCVIGYLGNDKIIEIPDGVLSIAKSAFQNNKTLEKVVITSDNFRNIDAYAFAGCENLKEFQIATLKGRIGGEAFQGCSSLVYFIIPSGAMKIGNNTFLNCNNLKFISVPNTVVDIGENGLGLPSEKTVILGSKGSFVEEYASQNHLLYRNDSIKQRDLLLSSGSENNTTQIKTFNIFDEEIICDSSIAIFQDLIHYFSALSISFFQKTVDAFPKSFNDLVDTNALNNCLDEQIRDTVRYLEKLGIVVRKDMIASEVLEERNNYVEICNLIIDAISNTRTNLSENIEKLKQELCNEADSQVTGSSFGIIGGIADVAAYNVTETITKFRQAKKAYKEAGKKLAAQAGQMRGQVAEYHADFMEKTAVPALNTVSDAITNKLVTITYNKLSEYDVISRDVIEKYSISKSMQIIEKAKKDSNLDKQYATALALKYNPANVFAYGFAIGNDCFSPEVLNMLEFLHLDENKDFISQLTDSLKNEPYKSILEFKKKNETLLTDNLINVLNNVLNYHAKKYQEIVKSCFEVNFKDIMNKEIAEITALHFEDLSDKEIADINIEDIINKKTSENKICKNLKKAFNAELWGYLSQNIDLVSERMLQNLKITKEEIKGEDGFYNLLSAVEKFYINKYRRSAIKQALNAEIKKRKRAIEEKERQNAARIQREQKIARIKKNFRNFIIFACSILVLAILLYTVVIPATKYKSAVAAVEKGDIIGGYEALVALNNYRDSKEKAQDIYENYIGEKLDAIQKGDTIFFGSYEQDNRINNGKEAIEWIVLDVQDGKALLLSKYGLDCKQYNAETDYKLTWETCLLRKWLNNDFMDTAFSAEDKARIPQVTVPADKNPKCDEEIGNPTQDQVFLLSIIEFEKYLHGSAVAVCEPSDYAVANGCNSSGKGLRGWWLRTPGALTYDIHSEIYHIDSDFAAYVWVDNISPSVVTSDDLAVRPAIWINLNQ